MYSEDFNSGQIFSGTLQISVSKENISRVTGKNGDFAGFDVEVPPEHHHNLVHSQPWPAGWLARTSRGIARNKIDYNMAPDCVKVIFHEKDREGNITKVTKEDIETFLLEKVKITF